MRSQKSSVTQIVPCTVAAAKRPWVRKRPWPLPNRLRTGLRRAAATARAAPAGGTAALHLEKSPPLSLRCVTGRVALGWWNAKTAPENLADCVVP